MRFPRLSIAGLMKLVAFAALNLAAVHALYDGTGEELLYLALPTGNVMSIVVIAGIRRPALRPFALGFLGAGTLSLVAFLAWTDANPWTFLRYFEPPCQAIERLLEKGFPNTHMALLYAIVLTAFAIPHAVAGLAGGWLAAKVWSRQA
jgi:hypothetical protein